MTFVFSLLNGALITTSTAVVHQTDHILSLKVSSLIDNVHVMCLCIICPVISELGINSVDFYASLATRDQTICTCSVSFDKLMLQYILMALIYR